MEEEELKRLFESMRQENASNHAETRRHFDSSLERQESRFDALAEMVALLDAKVDRDQAETRHEFAETRSMIKLSYSALDQRLTSLE